MGLFDTIRCEPPLPDGGDGADMQTKSLGCALESYVITTDGRLRRAEGSDTGFHGVMRFYTADPGGLWREYEAKFTDGRLCHIVLAAQARFGEDGLALSNAAPAFTPAFTFTRMRSARPSDRLAELRRFYVDALGCALLGEFTAHDGFDGLIVGHPSGAWQIEFVREHARPAPPAPSHEHAGPPPRRIPECAARRHSSEHLLVFYVADRIELAERAAAMAAAGCTRTAPNNPYWSRFGVTFVDPDGYPVVLAVPHGA